MPEYVYALHDFTPEHEDEVSFHAGERIEVIEKDEEYGDGWWQGRNLAGQVGLFPQSYTTNAPPESIVPSTSISSSTTEVIPSDANIRPTLSSLQKEGESESPTPATTNIVAPVPQFHVPAIFLNEQQTTELQHGTEPETLDSIPSHQRTISSGEEVMKATMTDVQKAIEQLGRSNAAGDEARSFSFASSKGDVTEGETDTEYEMSDVDVAPSATGGETWHKGARTKLAERAKRAVEEAEKLEAMMSDCSNRAVPPIEVEMSDESEGEEEYTTHSGMFTRDHPHIPEEEEGEEEVGDADQSLGLEEQKLNSKDNSLVKTGTTGHETRSFVLEQLEYEPQTATAAQTSFSVFHPPSPSSKPGPQTQQPEPPVESKRSSNSNTHDQEQYRGSLNTPTPTDQSKHNSATSAASTRPSTSGLSQPPLTASSIQTTLVEDQVDHPNIKEAEKEKKHPLEWDVGEVIEWLKGRGFDQDVCEKFTEQEITGDVLLELDVNLLKTELGIMAFGKRMRIANAITDLRRPSSIAYSDSVAGPGLASLQRSPSLFAPHSPLSIAHSQGTAGQGQGGQGHSRGQSQAHSSHSFPGTGSLVGQVYNYAPVSGSPMVYANGNGGYVESPEAMYHVPPGEQTQMQVQGQGHAQGYLEPVGMGMSVSAPMMVNRNGKSNGRPANLMLSPSDGVLKTTAIAVSDVPDEEDRGAASEGEPEPTGSMRRRLFGRSYDSNNSLKLESSSRHSRDGSISGKGSLSAGASPTVPENGKGRDKEKEREKRSKKSGDSTTGKGTGDRLSIFGSTFGGTLGKGRKPPPKYNNVIDEANSDHSPLSFFGLSSSSRKVSDATTTISHRDKGREHSNTSSGAATPGTSTPKPSTPKSSGKESRDPALLRKRTSSAPAPPMNLPVAPLKQGMSILEQIGEADHKGWMRKKGDRYNSWKLRYFVLKGPDLYCLRSNSPVETKIKGYVHILGYKVTVDENVNPGRYGFRIDHEHDKTHYFSSDEKSTIRDWMKAIMKATIGRDYSKPVISSCNIPTIPLMVAQAMNPAPRPPSPGARAATQKALRRENTNQLSTRDARVLMGLPSAEEGAEEQRPRIDLTDQAVPPSLSPSQRSPALAPARPSKEMRRFSPNHTLVDVSAEDSALIEWANSHLPLSLQISDPTGSICGGLHLLRIAESIKGKSISPPVLDSAFPQNSTDDKIDGLFQLFDFLLENDVKMGSVSINDVRQGKRDKIVQLLRALKAWEDKRRALATSIGSASPASSGSVAPMLGINSE